MIYRFEGADQDPDLTVELALRDGRPQCTSVTITAKDGSRPVRTADLEDLAVDRLTARVYARQSLYAVDDPDTGVTSMTPIMDEREFWAAMKEVETALKAPRRGTTRASLEQVARIYAEYVDKGPAEILASCGPHADPAAMRSALTCSSVRLYTLKRNSTTSPSAMT